MTRIVNAAPRIIRAAMYDQDPDAATEGRTYGNYSAENVRGEVAGFARVRPKIGCEFRDLVRDRGHEVMVKLAVIVLDRESDQLGSRQRAGGQPRLNEPVDIR